MSKSVVQQQKRGHSKAGVQQFGSLTPWAEAPWYSSLSSPYYNDSHRKLRKYVRDYLEEYVEPYAMEWEREGKVPKEEALRFVNAGLAFQDVPERYRPGTSLPAGIPESEWDIFHFLVLSYEKTAIVGGVMAGLGGASAIGAPPIVNFGTEEQKQKWLPGLFNGKTTFCLGATEPTGGSDLANLKTTAEKTADGKFYVVNGNKKWITAAPNCTHMTTAVRTGGPGAEGVSVLVIELDSPGVHIRKIHNSGSNAGNASWVRLENVRVPVGNLIGKENHGFITLMTNFNTERLLISVHMNRLSRICIQDALEYAHDRTTWGVPLIDNQIIRNKFVTMARYVESHWAWIEQLAYHIKVNGSSEDLASRIALAKVHGGRMLELCNREAQQVFGGAGYSREGPGARVEQISRELRQLVVGGGSEEIISDLALRQEMQWAKRRGCKL